MSYHVFFSFSQGLNKPLTCPQGTLAAIAEHVTHIESVMGIEREKYKDNPVRWNHWKQWGANLKDDDFCREADVHNAWVIGLYHQFDSWFKEPPKEPTEIITPEQAAEFWPALQDIPVPVSRWSKDHYRVEMETLYEVMRGRPTNGITFGVRALTPQQASQVINLFSQFLDTDDLRLCVPNGQDHLKSSYDGGYNWCEKCGAVDEDDLEDRIRNCPRRKCPIKEQYGDEQN